MQLLHLGYNKEQPYVSELFPVESAFMNTKYPFKNLVFKGGGVKAFAYHGAVEVFEASGILPQIERVAGTSAGAIQAAALSFRLSAEETVKLTRSLDYSKIAPVSSVESPSEKRPPTDTLLRGLEKVMGGMDVIRRFLGRYGLHPNIHFKEVLENMIAPNCQGNGRATFADFQTLGFRDLTVVAANLTKHSETIFSVSQTPDVAVADALLMSASLPFFFEAPQFDGEKLGQGDYIVDGGVLANYPIHLFDDPLYEKSSLYFQHGINWETLGCRLYTPDDCPDESKPVTNMLAFIENLLDTYSEGQTNAREFGWFNQLRSINISDCCVSTTDLNIKPDGNDPKYLELLEAGRTAAIEYLDHYELPVDGLYLLKTKLMDIRDWLRQ